MRLKIAKKIISIFLALTFVLQLSGCYQLASDGYFNKSQNTLSDTELTQNGDSINSYNGELYIHVIDVNQGLSVLLEYKDKDTGKSNFALYDGGGKVGLVKFNAYMLSHNVDSLDAIICSHYHEDHVAGLIEAYSLFSNSNTRIYLSNYKVSDRKIFTELNALLTVSKGMGNVFYPKCGNSFSLGNAKITFLLPDETDYEDENNRSMGIIITYGNTQAICLGDMESEAETDLVSETSINLTSQLYIAGHHGSYTSSSIALLDRITDKNNPHYAAVSCGDPQYPEQSGNEYGHPHQIVLDRLQEYGYISFFTYKSGSIVYKMNGNSISIAS